MKYALHVWFWCIALHCIAGHTMHWLIRWLVLVHTMLCYACMAWLVMWIVSWPTFGGCCFHIVVWGCWWIWTSVSSWRQGGKWYFLDNVIITNFIIVVIFISLRLVIIKNMQQQIQFNLHSQILKRPGFRRKVQKWEIAKFWRFPKLKIVWVKYFPIVWLSSLCDITFLFSSFYLQRWYQQTAQAIWEMHFSTKYEQIWIRYEQIWKKRTNMNRKKEQIWIRI